jgi:hypothetical protein
MKDVQECLSCKAQIVWMKTAKGKSMPVNYDERVKLFLDFTTPRPLTYNHQTMISHFATCPDAGKFRLEK